MYKSTFLRYSLILLLVIPLCGFSQHAVIAATKMNVLYVGVENPVSFAVENTSCDELTMAVEKGSAQKTSGCNYNVVVTKPGTTNIYLIKGRDTISKTTYRIKTIPNPSTSWGNAGPYWFKLDSLRTYIGLLATTKYFDFDDEFSIASFEITVIRNKKLIGSKKIFCSECFEKIEKEHYVTVFHGINKGADFNDSLKEFIQNKIMPGDKVFIEDIKVLGPDNQIRQINPFVFSVQ